MFFIRLKERRTRMLAASETLANEPFRTVARRSVELHRRGSTCAPRWPPAEASLHSRYKPAGNASRDRTHITPTTNIAMEAVVETDWGVRGEMMSTGLVSCDKVVSADSKIYSADFNKNVIILI